MKWIGQHIWDFISRFRSDVYLEATETGTIASGGNLGLDSNNKIVKAAEVGSSVDLTSAEVTGVLTVDHGGTGASSLTDNSVLTGTGSGPITAEANLTFDGTALTSQAVTNTFTHSTTGQIEIINTGNNTTSGLLKLTNNRGQVGVDGDTVGKIQFRGNDDDGGSGNMTQYAEIEVESSETANSSERGRVYVKVASPTERAALDLYASADNVINAGIGYGATSTTTIAGTLTMGSTAFVNNSGVVQVATQGTIDHDSLANFVANEHIDWTGDVSASSVIHTNNITDLHGAGVDGSANQLLTDDGDGTVTSESNLTWDGDDFKIVSAATLKPVLTLESTILSNKPPKFSFYKNRTGTDGDFLGEISWDGKDASGNDEAYSTVSVRIEEATHTDEAARADWVLMTSDGTSPSKRNFISGLGSASAATVDVDLGYGTASTTSVAGMFDTGGKITIKSGNYLYFNNAGNTNSLRISGNNISDNRTMLVPDTDGNFAVSESSAGKQYWHHTFGGYKTNVNNTTGYYFQYRNGNDAWNNFDSSISSISQYDSYAGFLIAPRDGTIENVKIIGYTSYSTGGGGSGNEFAFYFKKAASSSGASSVSLTDMFNTSDITPNATSNRTFSHTEDFSSSNSFSEGDVLYCFIRKTATAGVTNFYFTLTISGYW